MCLLNAGKKADYDRRLRQQLAAGKAAAADASAAAEPEAVASIAGIDQPPYFDLSTVTSGSPRRTSGKSAKQRKKQPWPMVVAVGTAGLCLIVLLVAILLFHPGSPSGSPGQPDHNLANNVATPQSPKPTVKGPAGVSAGAAAQGDAPTQPSSHEAESTVAPLTESSHVKPDAPVTDRSSATPPEDRAAKPEQDTSARENPAEKPAEKPAAESAQNRRRRRPRTRGCPFPATRTRRPPRSASARYFRRSFPRAARPAEKRSWRRNSPSRESQPRTTRPPVSSCGDWRRKCRPRGTS